MKMLKYPNLLIGSMGLSVSQNIQFNYTERINLDWEKYLKPILRRNQMSQGRFLAIQSKRQTERSSIKWTVRGSEWTIFLNARPLLTE